MLQDSESEFQKWIDKHNIPYSVKQFLIEMEYDTMDNLRRLTREVINKLKLSSSDKYILKEALKLNENLKEELIDNEENFVKIDQHRWREFGYAKLYHKWNKNFYPVELFSPDGYWAWNAATKSLTYKTEKLSEIWEKFDDGKPGWMMSPPVLLPSELGAFKFTFSLRLTPEEDDEIPKIQMFLVNDGYNKKISNFYILPLILCVEFNFISSSHGTKIGDPLKCIFQFNKLPDSYDVSLPDNILASKRAPIISVNVSKI